MVCTGLACPAEWTAFGTDHALSAIASRTCSSRADLGRAKPLPTSRWVSRLEVSWRVTPRMQRS